MQKDDKRKVCLGDILEENRQLQSKDTLPRSCKRQVQQARHINPAEGTEQKYRPVPKGEDHKPPQRGAKRTQKAPKGRCKRDASNPPSGQTSHSMTREGGRSGKEKEV